MTVICQYIRDKDHGGWGGGHHAPAVKLGCWIWLLAPLIPSSWDVGVEDRQLTVFVPALGFPWDGNAVAACPIRAH